MLVVWYRQTATAVQVIVVVPNSYIIIVGHAYDTV